MKLERHRYLPFPALSNQNKESSPQIIDEKMLFEVKYLLPDQFTH